MLIFLARKKICDYFIQVNKKSYMVRPSWKRAIKGQEFSIITVPCKMQHGLKYTVNAVMLMETDQYYQPEIMRHMATLFACKYTNHSECLLMLARIRKGWEENMFAISFPKKCIHLASALQPPHRLCDT